MLIFSATNQRNVSILRSDYLIKKIFDRDKSVQELMTLRDLLKRSENFEVYRWKYQADIAINSSAQIEFLMKGPLSIKIQALKRIQ